MITFERFIMEKRFVSNRYLDLTSTAMSEVDVLARRYPDLINFGLRPGSYN